jgi:steroid delta-isomerase-like uncharacterized protein
MGPAELFRRWYEEVWNQERTDLIPRYLADDAVVGSVDETGNAVIGPDGFRAFYDKMKASFPDIRFEVVEVIEQGDTAAGRWVAQLTHCGPQMGVAPTNRACRVTGMSFVRVADGKVVESWDEWDRLGLARAIGTVQMVAPPA